MGQPTVKEHNDCFPIPVIDFSGVSDATKRAVICEQLARASETIGFFEVINSGVSVEALNDAFAVHRDFFALPMEEKLTLRVNNANKERLVPFQLGYKHFPVLRGIQNRMEEMVFRDYHLRPSDALDDTYSNGYSGEIDPKKNWWPENPSEYRKKMERLLAQLGELGDLLLDIFSEGLELPPSHIRLQHHRNETVPRYMHFHHYPKGTKLSAEETGLVPHKDSSIFTLVSQSDGDRGLEIHRDGKWKSLMPQKGGIIVNVGDILEAWSNGRYKSALHRVVSNQETGRYSFAYFCFPAAGPDADYIIKPIDKLITAENPPAYVPFSYHDFFKKKMQINSRTFLQALKISS